LTNLDIHRRLLPLSYFELFPNHPFKWSSVERQEGAIAAMKGKNKNRTKVAAAALELHSAACSVPATASLQQQQQQRASSQVHQSSLARSAAGLLLACSAAAAAAGRPPLSTEWSPT
jgi:hypothetical protein